MRKTRAITIAALLISATYIIAKPTPIYGAEIPGGLTGNSCSGRGLRQYETLPFACTDNGYGWTYYEYTPEGKGAYAQDIYFGPATTKNGGEAMIPVECAQEFGGFWHFGIYSYKKISKDDKMAVGPVSGYGTTVKWTRMSIDGYAAVGNPMHGGQNHGGTINGANLEDKLHKITTPSGESIGENFYGMQLYSKGAHKFYSDSNKNVVIAQSEGAYTEDEAWAAYNNYKIWYDSHKPDTMVLWDRPYEWKKSTIVAFCGEPPRAKTAKFVGTVEAKVNGSNAANGEVISINSSAESAEVTFTHTITRTDEEGPKNKVGSNWSTAATHPNASTGSGTAKLKKDGSKVVKDYSYTVPVSAGNTVEVCETLNYDKEVEKEDGVETPIPPQGQAKTCVKIKRQQGPDASGSFEATTSCTSNASTGGSVKVSSSACNTTLNTNSKSWAINHTGGVISHSSGVVPIGKDNASWVDPPYNHGQLAYGVSGTCIRSKNPYTHWEFSADGLSPNLSGETFYDTGIKDLPANYPNDQNWYDTGYRTDVVGYTPKTCTRSTCNYVGNGGNYSDSQCTELSYKIGSQTIGIITFPTITWTGSYNKGPDEEYACDEPIYGPVPYKIYHYNGCGDGTSTWYDFSSPSNAKQSWSGSDLLFANDTDETISIQKCSKMDVVKNYFNETWSGSSVSDACNTIKRWRRYANFNSGLTVKADAGTKSAATTTVATSVSESTIPIINTTDANGYFTVTFNYAINRGSTRNAMDGTGSENIVAKNKWSTMESIAPADGSSVTYPDNGTYDVWSNQDYFTTTQANQNNVATKTKTINGYLFHGQKVKICANVAYGKEVKEIDSDPYSKISKKVKQDEPETLGCVYVYRGESNCSNVVSAGQPGYNFGHQTGHNIAKIRVSNDSTGVTSPFTSWSPDTGLVGDTVEYSQGVWARPGDLVRYQVDYCMGANYAHAVHGANDITDAAIDPTLTMKGDITGMSATDTNKLTEKQRSNYLFGDTVGTYNPTTKETTSTIFGFTKRKADGTVDLAASIAPSNFIGTLYSPDITGSNKKLYACKNGGNNAEKDNYYQIASKMTRNGAYGSSDNYIFDGCGSNRTQSLDVGRQLSEQLVWTNMKITSATSATVGRDYSRKAYVYVPYNYTAKPFLVNKSTPTGTVQIGGKMTTTPGIAVFPRKNCAFLDGYTSGSLTANSCNASTDSKAIYATITKPTTVKLETLIDNVIVPGSEKTYVVRANTKSYRNGSKDNAIATHTESSGGPYFDNNYVIDVPNTVQPGQQVCIKMTITPADSHNSPASPYVWGASVNNIYSEDLSGANNVFWGLRDSTEGTSFAPSSAFVITCSTAVKRPTISVEDSNLYSATKIATSIVARKNGSTQYLYGSWTEYGIFGSVITGTPSNSVSSIGMASGAAFGYNQTSFFANHSGPVSGVNPQPLLVVTYNGGPKNGVHNYNYASVTTTAQQTRVVYDYERNDDGSHSYVRKSLQKVNISPNTYSFSKMPIVNAGNSTGSAKNTTTVCSHSTQTFANSNCDTGQVGTSGVGSETAESFTTNLLGHYDTGKLKTSKTDGADTYNGYVDITNNKVQAGQIEGDENAAMYKYVSKAFLGYTNGAPVNLATLHVKAADAIDEFTPQLSVGSTIIYKATNIVIGSSIIANNDEKNNAGDFRMPIIIADYVWLTGDPTQIDAIIIANKELNTCKWNTYTDFINNNPIVFENMNSDLCNKTVRFTAPVVVKGKVILNRTAGAGAGDDQIRRAEIFELNPATYLWSFAEASRYNQAITTYSRELPSRY